MRVEEVVGIRIRAARESNDMTQEELGEKLGALLGRPWSRQAVSTAEKGGRAFTAAELVALAVALGTTVPRLFTPPSKVWSVEMPNGTEIERPQLVGVTDPEVSGEGPLAFLHNWAPDLLDLARRMSATSQSTAQNERDVWRLLAKYEELKQQENYLQSQRDWARLREEQAAEVRRGVDVERPYLPARPGLTGKAGEHPKGEVNEHQGETPEA